MLTKKCLNCGILFEKPPCCGLPEWNTRRKFCSVKCANENKKGTSCSPGTQFSKERGFVPKTAIKKGQHLSRKTEFKKGSKLSEETKAKMRGRIPWNKNKPFPQMTGAKNPSWKGGTTPLVRSIRVLRKYKEWRKACFERDDHRCVKCGTRGEKGNRIILNCDHIVPFYKIIEDFKITTVREANQCEFLWDITNGRTLCLDCHKETETYGHNQYTNGKKNDGNGETKSN